MTKRWCWPTLDRVWGEKARRVFGSQEVRIIVTAGGDHQLYD
jgi:hypothetical protein